MNLEHYRTDKNGIIIYHRLTVHVIKQKQYTSIFFSRKGDLEITELVNASLYLFNVFFCFVFFM